MSKLTRSSVNHIAELANFELSDKEINNLREDLSETLKFIKKLAEIDTRRVNPTSNVSGLKNIVRDDISRPSLSQDQALKNAPDSHNCFFKTESVF